MKNLVCVVFIFSSTVFAEPQMQKLLLKPYGANAAWNEDITFESLEGHHINLKSPNSCGPGNLIQVFDDKVICRMQRAGLQSLEIFVCDNKNTFCKREKIEIKVTYPHDFRGWLLFLKSFL